MLYFLIFLIPFSGSMIYLLLQNNRNRAAFRNLREKLSLLSTNSGLKNELDFQPLESDFVISDSLIKQLELQVEFLVENLGQNSGKFVSNRFIPKIEKLRLIEKKLDRLEEVAVEPSQALG